MQGNEIRRLMSGLVFMLFGSVLVVGTILMINRFAKAPEQEVVRSESGIQVDRKPPPPPEKIEKREPPKPQRSRRNEPPLANLDASLSGIDVGLPGMDSNDLNSLQDELLGDTQDVVMTDDSVDEPPRATRQMAFQYPSTARSKGVEGYVVLSLLISATGDVEKVEILDAQPSGVFEDSVLQGIRDWEFEPAQYQGRNVKVWARQRVRFSLS
jgi:protein TonB